MFENLTERLDGIFRKLKGHGRLDEENVNAALKDIRMALLEADVNFKVVKKFIEDIRSRAIGQDVLASLTPGQQIVKIVHDRLIELMGGGANHLKLSGRFPAPVMMVGLQGCGKTTTTAKLAKYLMAQGKRVSLVSVDVYRPAAMEQLKILANEIGAGIYDAQEITDPLKRCNEAIKTASSGGYDTLLIDTAGRLHIDEEMMDELKRIQAAVHPSEVILTADAMTGQDAVSIAEKFNDLLGIDGIVLTKMDGDARGGAALSIREVTGKPIKFIGVGEKLDALEVFHAERMASRILGMGDILTLVEKAQNAIDEKAARELEKKIRKDSFTLEDFRDQLTQIRKMGSLKDILSMIPGFSKVKALKDINPDEKELVRTAAIIDSMTRKERQNYLIIDGQRRKRIAKGSGTTVQDVNRLLKSYAEMLKMMKRMSKGGMKSFRGGRFPFQ